LAGATSISGWDRLVSPPQVAGRAVCDPALDLTNEVGKRMARMARVSVRLGSLYRSVAPWILLNHAG